MIGLESLRWALTCALAVATMFHLVRVLRPAGAGFVDEVLHLFMGGSMIAMIWPWGSGVPAGVWVTGFTLSVGWFVSRAILATGSRLAPIHFAGATAAMLWMAATTSTRKSEMSGMGHEHMTVGRPAWISAVLGAYLVAAALWWTARGMGLRPGTMAPLGPQPGLAVAGSVSAPPQLPRWPEVSHTTNPPRAPRRPEVSHAAIPPQAPRRLEVSYAAIPPQAPRWPEVCHAAMSAAMGLALLAMM